MQEKIMKAKERVKIIRKKIVGFEDFRSGSISEQYNVCGKSGCACKDKKNPKKHGPYYQASFRNNKKHSTLFVRDEKVEIARNEIENYQILKQLFEEWVSLSTLISNYKLKK